jgi:opacity protein-like surface antigen
MARTSRNKQSIGRNPYGLAAAGATLLLATANVHAQSASNVFLDFNGGGAFQQDVSVQSGFNGVPGHMQFAPGWCLTGDAGYSFSRLFSADLESGVVWNDISSLDGQSLAGIASAHLAEIPVLANGVFTYPLGHFKPYLGAGLGLAVGVFESSNIPGSGPSFSDTDLTFAYQFQVGLKYSLNQNMELGLSYRFFGTSGHSWTDNGISLNTDGTMTHLIEATFTWRF